MARRDLHLRGPGLLERSSAEQLVRFERPATELETDPVGHVERAGVDGAGRSDDVEVAHRKVHERLVQLIPAVSLGELRIVEDLADVRPGAVHLQRSEQTLLHHRVPVAVGSDAGRQTRREVHHVVVEERLAVVGPGLRGHGGQQDLIPRQCAAGPEDTHPREAGAMRAEVADRHALVARVDIQVELRQVLRDRVVPRHQSLLDEHRDDRRREGLRRRSGREEGVRIDRCPALDVGETEPACQDHLVVLDDRDRDAGDVQLLAFRLQLLAQPLEPRIEIRDLDRWCRGRLAEHRRREADKGQDRQGIAESGASAHRVPPL